MPGEMPTQGRELHTSINLAIAIAVTPAGDLHVMAGIHAVGINIAEHQHAGIAIRQQAKSFKYGQAGRRGLSEALPVSEGYS